MKAKRAGIFTAVLLAAGLGFCGCKSTGSFDASGYVESVLDANYYGEYEDYARFRGISEEEAMTELEENRADRTEDEFVGFGEISEDEKAAYSGLMTELDKLMRYEVGEAGENDDGSYTVPVTIEPANVYQTLEQYSAEVTGEMLEQGKDPSVPDRFVQVLNESLKRAIDGIEYKEPVTIEIVVSRDSEGAYGISDADMQKIAETMMPR